MIQFADYPTARMLTDDHTRGLRRSARRSLFRRPGRSTDQRAVRAA